jgi:glycosyltransferase involved in cell wall biosynthesis
MKVTVLIPTFNYANYILDAIKSIEAQTYPLNLIEIVIIDDGSSDNTKEIIESYKSRVNVFYYYQVNKGKAQATGEGIKKSTGEVIFNLDADDYFYPGKINDIISIYKKHPKVVSVGHPADIFYSDTNLREREEIPIEICNKEMIGILQLEYFLDNRMLFGGGSTFSAKTSVLKLCPIPDYVDMYIDEYLIFLTYSHGNIYLLNNQLSVWRVHGKNYSVEFEKKNNEVKLNRLKNSSEAMMNFISNNIVFSNRIKNLYNLKHLDREFSHLEVLNQKKNKDILRLVRIILSGQYSFKNLTNYRLFNRVIPVFILNKFKLILNYKNKL